jgi:transposase InsO family protein
MAELKEILSAVHFHEGGDELFRIVRGIVSKDSKSAVVKNLRDSCRQFVADCEACTMCKVKDPNPVLNKLRRLDCYLPIRYNAHGEPKDLSEAEVAVAARRRKAVRRAQKLERKVRGLLRAQGLSGSAFKAKFSEWRERKHRAGRFPGQKVHMDIVGPWLLGSRQCYIVTLVDSYSNYVDFKWLYQAPKAEDCADLLTSFCHAVKYCVDSVVVDNGAQFRAQDFELAASHIGAKVKFVGMYAHSANGKVERFHRSLNERVRAGIYDRVQAKLSEVQGLGYAVDTVGIEADEVERITRKVVLRWNATARANRPSPHSLMSGLVISEARDEEADGPRYPGDRVPRVGEYWTIRVAAGEHPVLQGAAISPKLKQQYLSGQVMEVVDRGLYRVRLGGHGLQVKSRLLIKERMHLIKPLKTPDTQSANDPLTGNSPATAAANGIRRREAVVGGSASSPRRRSQRRKRLSSTLASSDWITTLSSGLMRS